MVQEDKFYAYEKKRIEDLLSVLYPYDTPVVKKGELGEPDGIAEIGNVTVGIEVRRFSDTQLQSAASIRRIGEYLKDRLKGLSSTAIVQINGNQIPTKRATEKAFMVKIGDELLKIIPGLDDYLSFDFEGVAVSISQSNNKSLTVNFPTSYIREDLIYANSVIRAVEIKQEKKYTTKINWLLLIDKTNIPFESADLIKIRDHFSLVESQFQNIFILSSWMFPSLLNPEAIQIFPSFKPLFTADSISQKKNA